MGTIESDGKVKEKNHKECWGLACEKWRYSGARRSDMEAWAGYMGNKTHLAASPSGVEFCFLMRNLFAPQFDFVRYEIPSE